MARLGASLKAKPKGRKAQAKKTLKKITQLAEHTIDQSVNLLSTAAQCSQQRIKPYNRFSQQITLAQKILEQTCQKLHVVRSIPDRFVSFYDPECRAIVKGKLNKPVEFGRTLQLAQDSSGVILNYEIFQGNPNDRTQAVPMVKRIKKHLGLVPGKVAKVIASNFTMIQRSKTDYQPSRLRL